MSAQAWLPPRKRSLDSKPKVFTLMCNRGWFLDPAQMEILRSVRDVLADHRILNVGKIFP